jgi:hypothetical protein
MSIGKVLMLEDKDHVSCFNLRRFERNFTLFLTLSSHNHEKFASTYYPVAVIAYLTEFCKLKGIYKVHMALLFSVLLPCHPLEQ